MTPARRSKKMNKKAVPKRAPEPLQQRLEGAWRLEAALVKAVRDRDRRRQILKRVLHILGKTIENILQSSAHGIPSDQG